MSSFKNVILDWSGTLVDDLPPVVDATNRVLAHYGKQPLSRDAFCSMFCLPFVDFYDKVLPGMEMADLDALYTQFFDASDESVKELPGSRVFLEYCEELGIRIFLLSSIKDHHFEKQSEKIKFRRYFEHVYTEVLDKRKYIDSVLNHHHLNRDETMFVGDMQHDIETARGAGVFAVATLTGYNSRDLLMEVSPDLIVENLSNLIHFLRTG